MLKAIEPPGSEPLMAIENQGEFPTLTDQGEQINPRRRTDPDDRSISGV
jgi:hypothetical protein